MNTRQRAEAHAIRCQAHDRAYLESKGWRKNDPDDPLSFLVHPEYCTAQALCINGAVEVQRAIDGAAGDPLGALTLLLGNSEVRAVLRRAGVIEARLMATLKKAMC